MYRMVGLNPVNVDLQTISTKKRTFLYIMYFIFAPTCFGAITILGELTPVVLKHTEIK